MQKITFNDKFGLTQAVLEGRKTMERMVINASPIDEDYINRVCDLDLCVPYIAEKYGKYKIGEVVAVAQAYGSDDFCKHIPILHGVKIGTEAEAALIGNYKSLKGWNNKMLVRADLMPHQIRITDIKVERLRDISDEDILKEGLSHIETKWGYWEEVREALNFYSYETRRKALAALIDKVYGKGTWDSNPYCFCYSFEIVK